jgi:hypothetical protein
MKPTAETCWPENSPTTLAASVAPEDLLLGDYVATLSVIHEFPSFFWCCDSELSAREEVVRIQRTGGDEGTPLKIKAICLPFVLVKDTTGKHRTLDIRLCRLARLSPEYARRVWKALKQKRTT